MSKEEKEQLLKRLNELEARYDSISDAGLLDTSKYDLMPRDATDILDEWREVLIEIHELDN